MIKLGYPEKIAILVAGLILSVFGMMDFTGITQWGTGYAVLAAGYAMSIAGLFLVFMDLRGSADIMQEYSDAAEVRETLDGVPDDDYCVSLDGVQEYEDDTEFCDLTTEPAADVPEVE